MDKDCNAILSARRDASAETTKAAYGKDVLRSPFDSLRRWKPNAHRGRQAKAKEKLEGVAKACVAVGSPERAQLYDRMRSERRRQRLRGRRGEQRPLEAAAAAVARDGPGSERRQQCLRERRGGEQYPLTADAPAAGDGPGTGGLIGDAVLASGAGTTAGEGGAARPAMIELPCSLEELYRGATRKVTVKRSSTTLRREPQIVLVVEVKPGWKDGTEVAFAGEGDEIASTGVAQDVVFVVRERKHATFTREGSDLFHRVRVPHADAHTGFKIDVPSLDNRILRVSVQDVVTPSYAKVVRGEGMPSGGAPGTRGDLVITFDVCSPRSEGQAAGQQPKCSLPHSYTPTFEVAH